jgi:16S rRNA (cytosine967-C5)-methyltransferase
MRPLISPRIVSMALDSGISASPGAAVRAAAARLAARVVRDGVAAESALAAAPLLPARDAPLLRALLLGVLRWHHRLQWQVDQLVTRPLARKDTELAALLRVGLFQLQGLRIPDHAAVSATVEACGVLGCGHARGLVNAVLRRFQRECASLETRQASVEEARFSHPAWLIAVLRADWGDRAAAILDANNAAPPMWLRVNVRATDPEHYVDRLRAAGIAAERAVRLPAGVLLAEPQAMATLPGYDAGWVSVQDGAAQLAAGFMDLRPGLRVLDACAAPGGKTAHMLESCPGLAVTAIDRDAERLEAVRESLGRLRLEATLRAADALVPGDWWDGRPFDRILIDAPCSALGVIRRHPDIKLLRTPGDIDRAVEVQALLLRRLWPLLAPGGRLVYATCTVLARENRDQIAAFLAATPDAAWSGRDRSLQLVPGEANMDGFYYACLDKPTKQ